MPHLPPSPPRQHQAQADPERLLGAVPMLDAQERATFERWNRTAVSYPLHRSVQQLIEAQVARAPQAPALVFGSTRLSYAELNAKANQLARKLIEQGVGPDVLVGIATERSVEAFEVLFRYYGPRVRIYMLRQVRDAQAAEELMQETMIAVWNKAERYDPAKGAASTWIFTIARNLRIDAFRRERRPEFDPEDPAFVPDDVAPADAELDMRETSEQLHHAIAALPAEQASLLKLSFFEDQSHSAIATRLNLPLGTVKSRMRLAFEKLRTALAHFGDVS